MYEFFGVQENYCPVVLAYICVLEKCRGVLDVICVQEYGLLDVICVQEYGLLGYDIVIYVQGSGFRVICLQGYGFLVYVGLQKYGFPRIGLLGFGLLGFGILGSTDDRLVIYIRYHISKPTTPTYLLS